MITASEIGRERERKDLGTERVLLGDSEIGKDRSRDFSRKAIVVRLRSMNHSSRIDSGRQVTGAGNLATFSGGGEEIGRNGLLKIQSIEK